MTNTLIITATIRPPAGVPGLVRTDPQKRRDDYQRGFQFYLSTIGRCFDRIIFAENSNADVSEFVKMSLQHGRAGQVEIVSFDGLSHPAKFGKAYGEFKLIDHVHRHVCQPEENVRYWKVTGRYLVKNIASIVERAEPDVDLVCHCRNYRLRWTDMYLFGYTARGYHQLIEGLYHRFQEDRIRGAPEITFRSVIEEMVNQQTATVQRRFRRTPLVDGIRGSDNKEYLQDANLWKSRVRNVAATLLPALWI